MVEKNSEEGLFVRKIPTRQDFWLKTIGILGLLQLEEKYALLQQDWSQPLRLAKYMDHFVINRIKREKLFLFWRIVTYHLADLEGNKEDC